MQSSIPEDTELARRAAGGDSEAFGLLFDRWFGRAYDVAWHIVHDRDTAADVAQDTFATAWQQVGHLRQPESFGGWLLRIARNRALNRLQRDRRSRPVGSQDTLVTMDPRTASDPTEHLDQAEQGDLVWAASAALGEEDASLLSLHLRHEMGAAELAEELGVKPNAAHQRLFRLKKRLGDAIGAWILWHHGHPACSDLELALKASGTTNFDRMAASAIVRHARGCARCDDHRGLSVRPEALFAATPLVVAEPVLRAKVVAALEGLDVPVPKDQHGTEEGRADEHDPADATDTAGTSGHGEPDEPDGTQAPGRSPLRRALTTTGSMVAALALLTLAILAILADKAGQGTVETATSPAAGTTAGDENTSDHEPPDQTTTSTNAGSEDIPPGEVADSAASGDRPAAGTGRPDPPVQSPPPSEDDPATAEPMAAPEILRFTARNSNILCTFPSVPVEFVWATEGADSASLGPSTGPAAPVDPSGTATRCATPGETWALTATGPGGSDSRTTAAPRASGNLSTPEVLTNP